MTNGNSFTTTYTYEDLGNNRTTSRVSSITNGANKISYTYDELGNIKTIKEGDTLKATYYYDELSQLIREDNGYTNKTTVYTYDIGGNITSKIEYPYTTGELGTATQTINYTYGNANWKDQLTSYNGKAITYDAIGNPITYDGNTYTWQNGRELYSITNTTKGQEISYRYTEDGIRRAKVVNGEVTRYHLEGTKVIYEKKDNSNNIIYYIYDENDELLGLKYNSTKYWYIKNIQGDIIGILDNDMNQIVSYTYDTFGNTISVKDGNGNIITNPNNIGIVNPYRYRSYRYDYESGLYYLNSRYYVPEWGRFLNADDVLMESGSIIGNNLYVYCMNNPINLSDPNGNSAISAFLKTVENVVKKAATAVKKSLPDYTEELNAVLISNLYEMFSDRKMFGGDFMVADFYDSVYPGGAWDYKIKTRWENSISVPYLGVTAPFIYNGRITTSEAFGNINFGFVGTAIGFTPTMLFMGGGFANDKSKFIEIFKGPYYGDEFTDHQNIQYGIDLYNNYFK